MQSRLLDACLFILAIIIGLEALLGLVIVGTALLVLLGTILEML